MKETDLRLGNLVIRKDVQDVPFIMPVCRIDGDGFVDLSAGTYSVSCMMKELSGVPLSPEWLERAGFIRPDEWSSDKLDLGYLYLTSNAFNQVCLADKQGKEAIGYRCEYVHQLQNLYFALCGQELTFTQND